MDEAMKWSEIPEEGRAQVIAVLAREAERLEGDAERLQDAARSLGRASILEHHVVAALAFRTAIDVLAAKE